MKFKQACSEVVSDITRSVKNIKINNLFLNASIILSSTISFISWCGTWLTFFMYWITDYRSESPAGEDKLLVSFLFFITFLLTYFLMKVCIKMKENL